MQDLPAPGDPGTSLAYEQVGLDPLAGSYGVGWTDILRFKILKSLGVRSRSPLEAALPCPLLGRIADRRFRVSAHPIGIKR